MNKLVSVECPACQGKRKVIKEGEETKCPDCNGHGDQVVPGYPIQLK